MKGQRVLLDTMVIIEAHRVGCWSSLLNWFKLETVERCIIECASGNKARAGYVPLDAEKLKTEMTVHEVSQTMRTELATKGGSMIGVHDGERDLLSYALTQPPIPLVCCVDKAAIRLAHRLKMLERLIALDEMAHEAGNRKQGYARQYTKAWLAEFKMAVIMGVLR